MGDDELDPFDEGMRWLSLCVLVPLVFLFVFGVGASCIKFVEDRRAEVVSAKGGE